MGAVLNTPNKRLFFASGYTEFYGFTRESAAEDMQWI